MIQYNKNEENEIFQAKISRHFLFNALNSARALCLINPSDAAKFLEHLSECLIYTSDKKPQLIPLKEELDYISSYLYIQAVRFKPRLNVAYNIEKETYGLIPPFTLQLIVDNIFSNVLMKSSSTIEIKISAEDLVYISIEANSSGINIQHLDSLWRQFEKHTYDEINEILMKHNIKKLDITNRHLNGTKMTLYIKSK